MELEPPTSSPPTESVPPGAPKERVEASRPRGPDHELVGLPAPRRPWRRATLVTLSAGALASLALAAAVLPDVRYSLGAGSARDIGDLAHASLGPDLRDAWVRAEGSLSATQAIRYSRPLERDSYRLAQAGDNPRVWVQIRVPAGEEDPRFVPPDSFVGRLLPVGELGLRQRGLAEAVASTGLDPLPNDAWLLLDGESPAATRWVLGLLGLLLGFAAFNVAGLVRLLRPIPNVPGPSP